MSTVICGFTNGSKAIIKKWGAYNKIIQFRCCYNIPKSNATKPTQIKNGFFKLSDFTNALEQDPNWKKMQRLYETEIRKHANREPQCVKDSKMLQRKFCTLPPKILARCMSHRASSTVFKPKPSVHRIKDLRLKNRLVYSNVTQGPPKSSASNYSKFPFLMNASNANATKSKASAFDQFSFKRETVKQLKKLNGRLPSQEKFNETIATKLKPFVQKMKQTEITVDARARIQQRIHGMMHLLHMKSRQVCGVIKRSIDRRIFRRKLRMLETFVNMFLTKIERVSVKYDEPRKVQLIKFIDAIVGKLRFCQSKVWSLYRITNRIFRVISTNIQKMSAQVAKLHARRKKYVMEKAKTRQIHEQQFLNVFQKTKKIEKPILEVKPQPLPEKDNLETLLSELRHEKLAPIRKEIQPKLRRENFRIIKNTDHAKLNISAESVVKNLNIVAPVAGEERKWMSATASQIHFAKALPFVVPKEKRFKLKKKIPLNMNWTAVHKTVDKFLTSTNAQHIKFFKIPSFNIVNPIKSLKPINFAQMLAAREDEDEQWDIEIRRVQLNDLNKINPNELTNYVCTVIMPTEIKTIEQLSGIITPLSHVKKVDDFQWEAIIGNEAKIKTDKSDIHLSSACSLKKGKNEGIRVKIKLNDENLQSKSKASQTLLSRQCNIRESERSKKIDKQTEVESKEQLNEPIQYLFEKCKDSENYLNTLSNISWNTLSPVERNKINDILSTISTKCNVIITKFEPSTNKETIKLENVNVYQNNGNGITTTMSLEKSNSSSPQMLSRIETEYKNVDLIIFEDDGDDKAGSTNPNGPSKNVVEYNNVDILVTKYVIKNGLDTKPDAKPHHIMTIDVNNLEDNESPASIIKDKLAQLDKQKGYEEQKSTALPARKPTTSKSTLFPIEKKEKLTTGSKEKLDIINKKKIADNKQKLEEDNKKKIVEELREKLAAANKKPLTSIKKASSTEIKEKTPKSKEKFTTKSKEKLTTDRKEKLATESKEKVTPKGKEQLITDSKEKLAKESKEKVSLKGKEQLITESKEKLAMKNKEKVTPKSKEQLITGSKEMKSKEKLTTKSKEKTEIKKPEPKIIEKSRGSHEKLTIKNEMKVPTDTKEKLVPKSKEKLTMESEKLTKNIVTEINKLIAEETEKINKLIAEEAALKEKKEKIVKRSTELVMDEKINAKSEDKPAVSKISRPSAPVRKAPSVTQQNAASKKLGKEESVTLGKLKSLSFAKEKQTILGKDSRALDKLELEKLAKCGSPNDQSTVLDTDKSATTAIELAAKLARDLAMSLAEESKDSKNKDDNESMTVSIDKPKAGHVNKKISVGKDAKQKSGDKDKQSPGKGGKPKPPPPPPSSAVQDKDSDKVTNKVKKLSQTQSLSSEDKMVAHHKEIPTQKAFVPPISIKETTCKHREFTHPKSKTDMSSIFAFIDEVIREFKNITRKFKTTNDLLKETQVSRKKAFKLRKKNVHTSPETSSKDRKSKRMKFVIPSLLNNNYKSGIEVIGEMDELDENKCNKPQRPTSGTRPVEAKMYGYKNDLWDTLGRTVTVFLNAANYEKSFSQLFHSQQRSKNEASKKYHRIIQT